jgi:Family of unknown function (DUF6132)
VDPFGNCLHLINDTGGIGMQQVELGAMLAWIWHISPVLFGAAGGFLFNRFVGCKTGGCPITKNPWMSTIYGALLGAMLIPR